MSPGTSHILLWDLPFEPSITRCSCLSPLAWRRSLADAAHAALRLDPVATKALVVRGAADPVLHGEADRPVGGVAKAWDQAGARGDRSARRQLHADVDLAAAVPLVEGEASRGRAIGSYLHAARALVGLDR